MIIEGRSIAGAGAAEAIRVPANAEHIDASGFSVTPGFIEPHIHGSGGVDVMAGTYESLNAVSRIVARHGTTAFLPTTVSSPPEVLTQAVERLGSLIPEHFDGAQPLGIHLEGPFISAAKRGTHKPANIASPDSTLLEHWIRVSGKSLRLLTLAPELNHAEGVIRMAQASGVIVAMGHSNATMDEAAAAVDRNGITYAVHTFNAMRTISHRDPGIAGLVLTNDRVFAEIIADGIHVHPSVVRLFARAKGTSRVLLVTDSVSAADMPDGSYVLGQDNVNVVEGVCRDPEGRLAGSTLTQEVALRNFVTWTGWPFQDALQALTLNPARALNLPKKGILEPGADADLVVMDHNGHVMKTFVAGRLVFERGRPPENT